MTGLEFLGMKLTALKAGALASVSLYAGIGVFISSNLLLGFIEGFENIPVEQGVGMSLLFAVLAIIFNRWKHIIEKRKIAIQESQEQREKEKHFAIMTQDKEKHDAAMNLIKAMQDPDSGIEYDADFVKAFLDKD